jgi:hypothetical protein
MQILYGDQKAYYSMGAGDKAAGAWNWKPTTIQLQQKEWEGYNPNVCKSDICVPDRRKFVYRTAVNLCTGQLCICVPDSCKFVCRTAVHFCTGQLYICVQESCTFIYRTAVHLCTRQLYICVPDSCTFMYRTAVHLCTGHLYISVPENCTFMYRTAVHLCTGQLYIYVPESCTFVYRTAVHSQSVRKKNVRFGNTVNTVSNLCMSRLIWRRYWIVLRRWFVNNLSFLSHWQTVRRAVKQFRWSWQFWNGKKCNGQKSSVR